MSTFNYFECLNPLLLALGWKIDLGQIYQAAPHLIEKMTMVDLQNMMVNLGYLCKVKKTLLSRLNTTQFPCVFEANNGSIYIIKEHEGITLKVYNCKTKNDEVISTRSLIAGKAFIFYSETEKMTLPMYNTWFMNALQRFKPYIWRFVLLGFIINIMALIMPLFVFAVYDWVVPAKSIRTLMFLGSGIVFMLLFSQALYYLKGHLMAYLGARLNMIVGTEVMRRMLTMPLAYVEGVSVGGQVAGIRQFDSIREIFTGPLSQLLLDLPFVLIFIAVLAFVGGPIAIIPLVLVFLFIITGLILLPYLRQGTAEISRVSQSRQAFLIETSAHIMPIKYLAAEQTWNNRFLRQGSSLAAAQRRAERITSFTINFSQILMKIAGVVAIMWGAIRTMDGEMNASALVVVVMLVWRALAPLQTGFMVLSRLDLILMSIDQLNKLMNMPVERQPLGQLTAEFNGEILFKDVSFRYQNDSTPALRGVTMQAKPGEVVAIVGENGSGKSTMVKLLLGFYQPQGGFISIDGLNTRQMDPIMLRHAIAYAPQYCHFFHGTIAQNLRLSAPDANHEDILCAIADAGLAEAIDELPDGLETILNDRALKGVSAGFLQKLNLARAYIRNSKIMILDEPGSNIDSTGDEILREAIAKFRGKRTIIVITHRPSLMNVADRVLVLNQGTMRAFGPRDKVIEFLAGGEQNAKQTA